MQAKNKKPENKIIRFLSYLFFSVIATSALIFMSIGVLKKSELIELDFNNFYFALFNHPVSYFIISLSAILTLIILYKMWKREEFEIKICAVVATPFVAISIIFKICIILGIGLLFLWFLLVGGIADVINIFKSNQPAQMGEVALALGKILISVPLTWAITYYLPESVTP